MTGTSPPPGWYTNSDGRTRWWDGEEWTDHFQPVSDHPAPAPPSKTSEPTTSSAEDATPPSPVAGGTDSGPSHGLERPGRRKRILLIALAVIVAVGLGAAGVVAAMSGGPDEGQGSAASQDTSTPSTEEPEPTPETPTDDPSVGEFGETIEFEDGVAIKVTKPVRFKPSPQADMDGSPLPSRGVPVRFKVVISNNGTAATADDLPLIDVTSNGEAIQEIGIADPAFGIEELAKDTRILPGKKNVSRMGYFVVDPADVSVDVALGGYDTVTFSNAGG